MPKQLSILTAVLGTFVIVNTSTALEDFKFINQHKLELNKPARMISLI